MMGCMEEEVSTGGQTSIFYLAEWDSATDSRNLGPLDGSLDLANVGATFCYEVSVVSGGHYGFIALGLISSPTIWFQHGTAVNSFYAGYLSGTSYVDNPTFTLLTYPYMVGNTARVVCNIGGPDNINKFGILGTQGEAYYTNTTWAWTGVRTGNVSFGQSPAIPGNANWLLTGTARDIMIFDRKLTDAETTKYLNGDTNV